MITDACIFLNELDMLEARMEYLDQHVDRFVVVESNYTFNGKKKPYHIDNNYSRFKRFGGKLHYIKKDLEFDVMGRDFSNLPQRHQWAIEAIHRNTIVEGLTTPGDGIVLISDVDEIPNRELFSELGFLLQSTSATVSAIALQQLFFYYNFDCINKATWIGTVATTIDHVRRTSAETLRANRFTLPILKNGGWHLSYWGSPRQIQYKIDNFSHQEVNTPYFNSIDNIAMSINTGKDLFNRAEETWLKPDRSMLDKQMLDIFTKIEYKNQ